MVRDEKAPGRAFDVALESDLKVLFESVSVNHVTKAVSEVAETAECAED